MEQASDSNRHSDVEFSLRSMFCGYVSVPLFVYMCNVCDAFARKFIFGSDDFNKAAYRNDSIRFAFTYLKSKQQI